MTTSPPTKIACPSCGADLPIQPYGRVFTCEYCGSKCTMPTSPPAGSADGSAGAKVTLVIVPDGRRWGGEHRIYTIVGVGIAIVTMLLVFGWLLSYSAAQRKAMFDDPRKAFGRGGRLPLSAYGLAEHGGLSSPTPLVLDIDGDGIDDLISWKRDTPSQGGGFYVVALHGVTFKERWRSDELGRESGGSSLRLFRDGGNVLASAASALAALRVTDGKRRWAAALPDRPERIVKQNDTLLVTVINGREVALRSESGAITSAETGQAEDDDDDDPPPLESDRGIRPSQTGSSALFDVAFNSFEGLRVRWSYCPPGHLEKTRPTGAARRTATGRPYRGRYELRGSRIARQRSRGRDRSRRSYTQVQYRCDVEVGLAFATQSVGSPVDHLVGYDPEDLSEKWRLRLPPAESLARLARPPLVAYQGDFALVAFELDRKMIWLRKVNLESGREVWNARAPLSLGGRLLGLGLGRTRAFAHTGNRLLAFDAKSGDTLRQGKVSP